MEVANEDQQGKEGEGRIRRIVEGVWWREKVGRERGKDGRGSEASEVTRISKITFAWLCKLYQKYSQQFELI